MKSNQIDLSPKISEDIKPTKILRGMPADFELREGELDANTHPLYLMMNLETDCPLNCQKCAKPGRSREMGNPLSLFEREKMINMASNIGVRELVIIGSGEPTTKKNFENLVKPVIETAHKKSMGTVMFTTAFGIDKKQAEFYRDHDVTIFISLDSLNDETYKKMTGFGNLKQIFKNIQILRETYKDTQESLPNGGKIIRLGINVTLQKSNVDELDAIEKFAGDDMQFIVNVPMPEGNLRVYKNYQDLVGGDIEKLKRIAETKSKTGSHSSVNEGVCGYFHNGITVDSDGELLICAYASDSANHLGNMREITTAQDLLNHYQKMREKYKRWCESIQRKPSCPLRDKDYKVFTDSLG
ncbi:radical SAM protein [Patescibacteria group bacterium]|nr:radical SAM protein [Patescibacteria group bacterium]